tara:strand:- start:7546 stop:7800 length:255 start_codon:yes stop_codon:yes gene_type:complete
MKYINIVWNKMKDNGVIIIMALGFAVYTFANLHIQKENNKLTEANFACESLCFPQQHEYLSVGDSRACWCYVSPEKLLKYKDTK